MTRAHRSILERPLHLIAIWCVLLLVVAGALAVWEQRALVAELEEQSTALHALASQRADQHDAHMTALSAIAVAAEERRNDLFLDVAATITRFYPRIDEVQLVPLDPKAEVTGTTNLDPAIAEAVRAASRSSDGRIVLLPYAQRPGHYIMVKRSPNTDAARYGLMLAIDAERLIGEAGPFWSRAGIALDLSLPDGYSLVSHTEPSDVIRFSRPLSSLSQPLRLQTGMDIGIGDLLPPVRTGLVLLVVSLACLAGLAMLRQRARAGAAFEQARLSALEARLTHASRVNALGEMASGMAHELTQPLTAILAQAQAGRRMLSRGDGNALAPVLDDTVAQARRASAILERFRNWSRPQRAQASASDLRDAVDNVRALLGQEAAARGIQLDVHTPESAVVVFVDPVEMEQVAFNLVRNAIEAVEGMEGVRRVAVTLKEEGANAVLDVADTGPGVPEDLQARLFTPFTTSRPNGTELGLALSQRLVERAGGEIALVEGGPGATFRVVLPRRMQAGEAAQ